MFCSFDALFPRVVACFCVSHASLSVRICTAFNDQTAEQARQRASQPANEQSGEWVTEGVEDVGERLSQAASDGMNVREWVIHDCCCNVFSLAAAVSVVPRGSQRSAIRNNTTCCCINGCNAASLPASCAVATAFLLEPFKATGLLQFQVWIRSSLNHFQTVGVWPD